MEWRFKNQLPAGICFSDRYEYNTLSFPCLSATVVFISMQLRSFCKVHIHGIS